MSLLDIAKLPTAENSAIHLHAMDNVAIARVPLAPGQDLKVGAVSLKVKNALPAGHSVAVKDLAAASGILACWEAVARLL